MMGGSSSEKKLTGTVRIIAVIGINELHQKPSFSQTIPLALLAALAFKHGASVSFRNTIMITPGLEKLWPLQKSLVVTMSWNSVEDLLG